MLLTDLNEIKKILEVDPLNSEEDVTLSFFIEQASEWILEYLDRRDIEKKSRTEYYSGTNTQSLRLKARPTFTTPTIQCFVDGDGNWGQTSGAFAADSELTYGLDFVLKIDQDDGTSRSGLLIRTNDVWHRPFYRSAGLLSPFMGDANGNIKVVYTGGYTVDSLPAPIRAACNTLVGRMRYLFPLAMELSSESYEERHISLAANRKQYLMALVTPYLFSYRSWNF